MELAKSKLRVALHWAYSWDVSKRYDWLQITFSSKGAPLKVTCDHKVNKGGLVMVPLTTSIGVGARPPAQAVEVEDFHGIRDGSGNIIRFWLNPKFDMPVDKAQPGFLAPYWVAKAAPDSSLANLAPSALRVRANVSGQALAGLGAASTYTDVLIPVLVNDAPLKVGDELMQPPQGYKRPGTDAAASSSKAAKIS